MFSYLKMWTGFVRRDIYYLEPVVWWDFLPRGNDSVMTKDF